MTSEVSALFAKAYFDAAKAYLNPPQAQQHFERAFVEPLGFAKLVSDLRPIPGQRKVVIVDGHPRSGKSWCVLRALQKLIEERQIDESELWTSGLDSLGIFRDRVGNLYEGAQAVLQELRDYASLKLVLLDDFLGTNRPREIGSSLLDTSALPFFNWNNANPWLQAMPEGSTLILTGRSLHITVVEILLGINIRLDPLESANVKVINSRQGLFRTFAKDDLFGAFNNHLLASVCEKNLAYHPLPHASPDEQEWFIMAAPLLGFGHPKGISLSDNQIKRAAAKILFREDLDTIADLIERIEQVPGPDYGGRLADIRHQLLESYLVAIAPALLFLDQTAYKSLGVSEQRAIDRIAVRGLYLYESQDDFTCGRLPNEFYMTAIHDHLSSRLNIAASAFAKLASGGSLNPPPINLGLGLRGVLERRLNAGEVVAPPLHDRDVFSDLLYVYQQSYEDSLLGMELGDLDESSSASSQLSPGLAAAIGWALGKFRDQFGPKKVETLILQWFPRGYRELATHCTEEIWHSGTFADDLIAIYSVFLQWVFRLVRSDDSSDAEAELNHYLDVFEGLASEIPALSSRLRVVLEDECIWAAIERLGHPAVVERRLRYLSSDSPIECGTADEHYCLANRFFSLTWHNEWMEGDRCRITPEAERWIERVVDKALNVIEKEPAIVSDNLQYHWCHFITQRAAWMRDWVFHANPAQFERDYSQVASGSTANEHNEYFARIVERVISGTNPDSRSVRNVTLLLGTRASRVPGLEKLMEQLDFLMTSEQGGGPTSCAVLMAIFELGRQGFLESWSKENVTDEFKEWCKRTIEKSISVAEQAWDLYYDELERVTHLDLLPTKERGWPSVLPKEWGLNPVGFGGAE